jgi:hypothetical protein
VGGGAEAGISLPPDLKKATRASSVQPHAAEGGSTSSQKYSIRNASTSAARAFLYSAIAASTIGSPTCLVQMRDGADRDQVGGGGRSEVRSGVEARQVGNICRNVGEKGVLANHRARATSYASPHATRSTRLPLKLQDGRVTCKAHFVKLINIQGVQPTSSLV